MIDLNAVLADITSPQVTEDQLQKYLQQISSEITATNVALKISEENLLKSIPEGHEFREDIMQLIQNQDAETSKQLTDNVLSKLNASIVTSTQEVQNLITQLDEQASATEKANLQQILNTIQGVPTEEQLNSLLQDIQTSITANQSALAVQQNRLSQTLTSTTAEIAEDIKAQIANTTDENRLQAYQEIVNTLGLQIQESMNAFHAYQQSQQTERGANVC